MSDRLRVCLVVDGRSPIARNWVKLLNGQQVEVHVISTYPNVPPIENVAIYEVPSLFSRFAASPAQGKTSRSGLGSAVLEKMRETRSRIVLDRFRWNLMPLELIRQAPEVRRLLRQIQPDIVHSMRIPAEAMLAARAVPEKIPLIVSVWGNDFTFFASGFRQLGRLTRRVLRRADALHCDCHRDALLARKWGFDAGKPALVFPSCGGIQLDLFTTARPAPALYSKYQVPGDRPIVLNPRGTRNHVRNDAYFRAIPLVIEQIPEAFFVSSDMAQSLEAQRWVRQLGIESHVRLLPSIPHEEMPGVYQMATVSVSPSEHDGTPNSLLEGMACGVFPTAGNIESIREWITDGENGLLFEPSAPRQIADKIVEALRNSELRERAIHSNRLRIEREAGAEPMAARMLALYRDRLPG